MGQCWGRWRRAGTYQPSTTGAGSKERECVCVLGSVGGRLPDVLPLGNGLENSKVSYYHHHQPSLRTTTYIPPSLPAMPIPSSAMGHGRGATTVPSSLPQAGTAQLEALGKPSQYPWMLGGTPHFLKAKGR